MKIIIIKDCKDGNENEIVDVNPGYGQNFLIKNKFGVPFNNENNKALKKRLKIIKANNDIQKEEAIKIKDIIENMELEYTLKTSNNQVFGNVSRKQILHSLKEKKINIDVHMVPNIHIKSIGITEIEIELLDNIIAKLKVRVNENGK